MRIGTINLAEFLAEYDRRPYVGETIDPEFPIESAYRVNLGMWSVGEFFPIVDVDSRKVLKRIRVGELIRWAYTRRWQQIIGPEWSMRTLRREQYDALRRSIRRDNRPPATNPVYFRDTGLYQRGDIELPRCDNCSRVDRLTGCPEGHCENCCSCSRCERSGCTEWATCPNCERCDAHRGSFYCNGCDERRCQCGYERCDNCETCCCGDDCTDATSDYYFHSALRFLDPLSKERHTLPRRYVGVEIETSEGDFAEIAGRMCRIKGVNAVEDGSIDGVEYVTAPAKGMAFTRHISEVVGILNANDAKVDSACGLHVHVDARDFGWADIQRFMAVWMKVEPAMFSLVAAPRSNNHFCESRADTFSGIVRGGKRIREIKEAAVRDLYKLGEFPPFDKKAPKTPVLAKVKGNKYHPSRYGAVNVHSWLYRGTLEFRLHHGTLRERNIINWGRVCAALVEYAAKARWSEINAESDSAWSRLTEIMAKMDPHVVPWMATRRERFARR